MLSSSFNVIFWLSSTCNRYRLHHPLPPPPPSFHKTNIGHREYTPTPAEHREYTPIHLLDSGEYTPIHLLITGSTLLYNCRTQGVHSYSCRTQGSTLLHLFNTESTLLTCRTQEVHSYTCRTQGSTLLIHKLLSEHRCCEFGSQMLQTSPGSESFL